MFQKALAADIGTSVLSTPFMTTICRPEIEPPASGSAASAGLSAEEDYELTRDFLDVFARASERLAGFVVGCALVGAAWMIFSLL